MWDCRSKDGSPQFLAMGAVQKHLPGWSLVFIDEDTKRLLEAFQSLLPDLKPLAAAAHRIDDNQTHLPIARWWRGTNPADGRAYEVVLAPSFYGSGDWVLAGEDEAAVGELARHVVRIANDRACRCRRFMGCSWEDAPDMDTELQKVCWEDIILPKEQRDDIQRTVETFFQQKSVFQEMGFPWRRGILLVGPPGTGKTMVCKAAARAQPETSFLYVRDVRESCRGEEAIDSIFAEARRRAPCILAIEDMDGLVYDGNRTRFLNELDGFKNNDGLLIIASSNHPHKIDEALLKRPSRFDRVYHIGIPAVEERIAFGKRLLAHIERLPAGVDIGALAVRVADGTEGFTPAFLKEAYLSAMLQIVQEGRVNEPGAYAEAVLEQIEMLRHYLKKAKNPEKLALFAPSNAGDGIGFRNR
jgi:AAA+ superfamily predicted ATPase